MSIKDGEDAQYVLRPFDLIVIPAGAKFELECSGKSGCVLTMEVSE